MSLYSIARKLVNGESRSALNDPTATLRDVFSSVMGFSDGTGVEVNTRSTIGYPPVAQAVSMIANDIAKLPLNVYRRDGDDRHKDSSHPVHDLVSLQGQPNDQTTAFDFWHDVMVDALISGRGKGLAWIERDGARPIGLYRLIAADWRPLIVSGQRYWANYGSPPVVVNDCDMLVIRGLQLDGLTPDDPIRLYAETIGVGLSNQRFASNFFGNGAHVGGVLMAPPGASEGAIKNVEAAVQKKSEAVNWFKTLVLRDGFRWQTTTVDPKQASLIEVDESSTRHTARFFNLPPSRLGLPDTVSYNSLESDNKKYYGSTLTPWLCRIAAQCNCKLRTPAEKRAHEIYLEHLIDALQWTDATSRANVATQGVQSGWLLADEVRRWHNLPALPKRPIEPVEPAGDQADESDDSEEQDGDE